MWKGITVLTNDFLLTLVWAITLGLTGFLFYRGAPMLRKLRQKKGIPFPQGQLEGKRLYSSTALTIEIAFVLSAFVGFIAAAVNGRIGIEIPWSIGASLLFFGWITFMIPITIRRLKRYQAPVGGAGDITQDLP